ncbi:MAG: class I SAM-dependent methyltransferase [Sulfurospirillaceae bacterium]|nr:class I SAM-dependent methyltransferase [Sulfurospirillaceae bacterium]MDD2826333.1 class I SAM-dependent methyltransferase [Sulfurospirillaceae bacterium]
MFFPEKIKGIQKKDKVLEVGPGNTPFYRSNVLLEKIYENDELAKLQAGGTEKRNLKKEIVYYTGELFPFKDKEFDYVICSHVLEHIPLNQLDIFIKELMRVASRGYIEVPLFTYEVLTNIEHHLSFVDVDNNNKLLFLEKKEENFAGFAYQEVLKMLEQSNSKMPFITCNPDTMFFGFEWEDTIAYEKVQSVEQLLGHIDKKDTKPKMPQNTIACETIKKCKKLLNINNVLQILYLRFGIVL